MVYPIRLSGIIMQLSGMALEQRFPDNRGSTAYTLLLLYLTLVANK